MCTLDSLIDLDDLLRDFSQAHEDIEFILEMEPLGGRPFLDVFLSRRQNGLLQP